MAKKEALVPKTAYERVQSSIIWFLRFTIALAIVGAVFNLQWDLVFSAGVVLLFTFFPYFFERRVRINLPIEFEFFMILFVYTALFLGEMQSYYLKFWWWDALLHTGSGVALGFAGFIIMYVLYAQNKIKANPVLITVFAFCFAMAIGAVWEIFEFAMDQLFGMNMQKNGLNDTMWDLIVDALGALLTSVLGYFYIKGQRSSLFRPLIEKFCRENPRYFTRKRR